MSGKGYGQETWCAEGGIKTGRYARGPMVVVQALYRRLITPRGVLRELGEAIAYGMDLSEEVGKVGYDSAIALLPARVTAELSRDDRVATVSCSLTKSQTPAGEIYLVLDAFGALADDGGEFNFTAHVDDVSLTLISANANA